MKQTEQGTACGSGGGRVEAAGGHLHNDEGKNYTHTQKNFYRQLKNQLDLWKTVFQIQGMVPQIRIQLDLWKCWKVVNELNTNGV